MMPARLSADLLHDEQKEFPCSYCEARAGDYCKVVAGAHRHRKAQFAHAPRAALHHAAKYGARS